MSDEAHLLLRALYYPLVNQMGPKLAQMDSHPTCVSNALEKHNNRTEKMPAKNNMQLVVARPQKKVPDALKRYVQSQLTQNIELRKFDISGTFPLNAVGLGPSASLSLVPAVDRDGEVVNFHTQRLSITVLTDPNATMTTRVRFMIFDWFPITVPTVSDVLEDVTQPNIIQSAHRFTTRQFYRVVSDQVYCLAPFAGMTSFNKVFELKNHRKVRYDDAIAPPAAMGLRYWIICTDNIGAVYPALAYHARLEFTDA